MHAEQAKEVVRKAWELALVCQFRLLKKVKEQANTHIVRSGAPAMTVP